MDEHLCAKPVIGITVDVDPQPDDNRTRGKLSLNWNYAQSIADAGGIPLLIPPQADPETVAALIDGWLIPGGNDIDPTYWGEPLHPEARLIASDRHESERRLYAAVPAELPILGVCYGCQFLNVVQGGSLIQHLPEVVGHEGDQRGNLQTYDLDPESKVAAALGTAQPEGQSWHHQAIGAVGQGLTVSGRNADGTIEAIESTERSWMIGVQWHPERTSEADDTQRLFRAFVEAAAQFRAKRR